MEWYHSRILSCFEVRKINAAFSIKQNILLLYMIIVAPLSRPDPFGGFEQSPGCSNVTQSPYQNNLSKTRRSVTLQLT